MQNDCKQSLWNRPAATGTVDWGSTTYRPCTVLYRCTGRYDGRTGIRDRDTYSRSYWYSPGRSMSHTTQLCLPACLGSRAPRRPAADERPATRTIRCTPRRTARRCCAGLGGSCKHISCGVWAWHRWTRRCHGVRRAQGSCAAGCVAVLGQAGGGLQHGLVGRRGSSGNSRFRGETGVEDSRDVQRARRRN